MDNKFVNLILDRRSTHVKLMRDTYAGFRIELFKRGLSMQEVFEHFAKACTLNDPTAILMLDSITEAKLHKKIEEYRNLDADAIYDAIANIAKDDESEDK